MATDDIALSLGIEFDAAHFQRQYNKAFSDMERSTKKMLGKTDSALAKFGVQMFQQFTKVPGAIQKANVAIATHNAELAEQKKVITQATWAYQDQFKKLKEARQEAEAFGDAATEAQKKAWAKTEKTTKALKDQLKVAQSTYDGIEKEIENLQDSIKDMEISFGGEELTKAAEEAGKELAEPLSALLNKDIEGAGKSLAKLVGKGFGALGHVGKAGKMLTSHAAARTKAGDTGAMTKAMGGLGQLATKLGPTLQTVSKIGPMIGMVGSAVAALVKLFIDADAQVKEFNKGMIEAGGSGQFFGDSLHNADLAASNMEDSLKGVRDAAYSLKDNLDWGISAETHKEVLQNLMAEGVQMKTLEGSYKQLNAQSSAYSKDMGSLTQAAVTYSRHMGVSLQEVTSFQAEMMTEIGMSTGSAIESFRTMSRAAEESGMATNKFYSIIRGVSADLALYNTRLEDAVKLLGKLGKVMSPRNAKQFMEWSMKAIKGMGRIQRLQTSLLADNRRKGATQGAVSRDIARDEKAQAEEISKHSGVDAKSLMEAFKKNDEVAIEEAISKAAPQQQGALREAASKLFLKKSMASKGTYGAAQAAGETGPAAQLSIMRDALLAVSGAKSLKEGVGTIGVEQMAENLGVSREQLDQFTMFEGSIETQRKVLMKNAKDQKERDKWANASLDEIYDTFSEGQKDQFKDAGKEEEYNKKIGKNLQSVTDKIGVFIDWFMNQFYNIVVGIYESILSLPGMDGGKKADLEFMKKAQKVKDPEVQKALAEASSADPGKAGAVFAAALKKSEGWQKLDAFMSTKQADPEKEARRQQMMGDAVQQMGEGVLSQLEGIATPEQIEAVKGKLYEEQGGGGAEGGPAQGSLVYKGGDIMAALQEAGIDPGKLAMKQIDTAQEFVDAKKLMDTPFAKPAAVGQVGVNMSTPDMNVSQAPSESLQSIDPKAQTKATAEGVSQALPATEKAGEMASESGSIYTHDIHTEELLSELLANSQPKTDPVTAMELMAQKLDTFGATGDEQGELTEEQLEQQETINGTLEEVVSALRQKGVRLDKSWMDNHMKKMVEDATLDALRVAMLEYYLLQTLGPGEVLEAMKKGLDPKALFKGLSEGAAKGQSPGDFIKEKGGGGGGGGGSAAAGGTPAAGTAPDGAPVTAGGTKTGGGGGAGGDITVRVELSLKGDLSQLIEAKAQEVIVRHEAAGKYR